jgi:hypothetical protein
MLLKSNKKYWNLNFLINSEIFHEIMINKSLSSIFSFKNINRKYFLFFKRK